MNDRNTRLADARKLLAQVVDRAEQGSIAHQLEAESLRAHIGELESQEVFRVLVGAVEFWDVARWEAPIFSVMPSDYRLSKKMLIRKLKPKPTDEEFGE